MKIESFEGIVLSETNYSESSKILNVLTSKYGLIGIMSKGCRNIKSKLRGVSRKLLCGTFHVYYKPNGLSTLISIDIISSYDNILTNLERISYASYLLDLINQAARQIEEGISEVFELLKSTLLKINEGLNPHVLTNICELKLLDYLGVGLNIDSCIYCGSDKQIVTLSFDMGGFICRNCYHDEPLVSEKAIKMLRMYYYVDIPHITKLDISSTIITEIDKFLTAYYDKYTGLYLKSKAFISKVNSL